MKRKAEIKRTTKALMALALSASMVAGLTTGADTQIRAASKAKLGTKKLSMTVGSTKKIALKKKVKKAKYSFKSKNKKIATVTNSGKVKAKKIGSTTITVKQKLGKKTITIGNVKVTVKKKSTTNNASKPDNAKSSSSVTSSSALPSAIASGAPSAVASGAPSAVSSGAPATTIASGAPVSSVAPLGSDAPVNTQAPENSFAPAGESNAPIGSMQPTFAPKGTPLPIGTRNPDLDENVKAFDIQKMGEAGVISVGNNSMIKKVINKAKYGEDVNIAYIGGSITEGEGGKPNSNCYAARSATMFANEFGTPSNVHFTNAGMSGTPSALGIIRYQRDVCERLYGGADHPDLLFIEFAVNDWGEATKSGAYEGLIRKAIKQGTAVFLIFSVFKNGTKSQNRVMEDDYKKIGEHYNLPMVSIGDAIKDCFDSKKTYNWFFNDQYHPTNIGHEIMAETIMTALRKIDAAEKTDDDYVLPAAFKTDAYENLVCLDPTTADKLASSGVISDFNPGGFTSTDESTPTFQYVYKENVGETWFPVNWMHKKGDSDAPFTFKTTCTKLLIAYKNSSSGSKGSADIYVDGEKVSTYASSGGWNQPETKVAIDGDSSKEHIIQIKMADDNADKDFTILQIGIAK